MTATKCQMCENMIDGEIECFMCEQIVRHASLCSTCLLMDHITAKHDNDPEFFQKLNDGFKRLQQEEQIEFKQYKQLNADIEAVVSKQDDFANLQIAHHNINNEPRTLDQSQVKIRSIQSGIQKGATDFRESLKNQRESRRKIETEAKTILRQVQMLKFQIAASFSSLRKDSKDCVLEAIRNFCGSKLMPEKAPAKSIVDSFQDGELVVCVRNGFKDKKSIQLNNFGVAGTQMVSFLPDIVLKNQMLCGNNDEPGNVRQLLFKNIVVQDFSALIASLIDTSLTVLSYSSLYNVWTAASCETTIKQATEIVLCNFNGNVCLDGIINDLNLIHGIVKNCQFNKLVIKCCQLITDSSIKECIIIGQCHLRNCVIGNLIIENINCLLFIDNCQISNICVGQYNEGATIIGDSLKQLFNDQMFGAVVGSTIKIGKQQVQIIGRDPVCKLLSLDERVQQSLDIIDQLIDGTV